MNTTRLPYRGTSGQVGTRIATVLVLVVVFFPTSIRSFGDGRIPPGRDTIRESNVTRVAETERASDRAKLAPALSLFVVVGVILLLIFVLATYVLVRAVRRYRRALDRARATPTAAEDVWAMHKVPDQSEDE